jgi:glycosyltransferase involved in cell wall biosynthesis
MVHADFAMAYAQLCMASAGLQLQLITVKSSIVAQARNNGVEFARNFRADYILFLDSDMLFPPTALFRLLLHRKDIVGATYTKRVAPFGILGSQLAEQPTAASGDLLEMQRIPTGCLLIKMAVFDKLAKPYFRFDSDADGAIVGEDYVFCDRAREAGFRIWCDAAMSREVGHIGQAVYRLPDAALHGAALPGLTQSRSLVSSGQCPQPEVCNTLQRPLERTLDSGYVVDGA